MAFTVPVDSTARIGSPVSCGNCSPTRRSTRSASMSTSPSCIFIAALRVGSMTAMLNEIDLRHLRRCVELAEGGLVGGDEPFGSVLVAADGTVRFEDRNRVAGGDQTRHPEF